MRASTSTRHSPVAAAHHGPRAVRVDPQRSCSSDADLARLRKKALVARRRSGPARHLAGPWASRPFDRSLRQRPAGPRAARLPGGRHRGLEGQCSISGYAFYLWNRPHSETDQYLASSAPIYLLCGVQQDHWPYGRHAVNIGLGSGGLDGYPTSTDQRFKGEGPSGHGVEIALLLRGTTLFDKLPPGPDPRHARLRRLHGPFSTAAATSSPTPGSSRARWDSGWAPTPPAPAKLALEPRPVRGHVPGRDRHVHSPSARDLQISSASAPGPSGGGAAPAGGTAVDLLSRPASRSTSISVELPDGERPPFRTEFPLILRLPSRRCSRSGSGC